jgi:hypothetical protein
MPVDESFERALHSGEPVRELRALALQLSSQGYDRTALVEKFEAVRQQLRLADREADEDAVMDVLDFLTGWCSPHMRLPQASGVEAIFGTPPAESGG